MKRLFAGLITVLVLSACSGRSDDEISRLSWLLGCWTGSAGDEATFERWSRDDHGLRGVAETGEGARREVVEIMTIRKGEDDRLEFVADPRGQAKTRFVARTTGAREIVFENPEHDFPQRIIYRLASNSELVGRIEGTVDGQERSADFPLRRVDCASL